jgi:hypothetical protein
MISDFFGGFKSNARLPDGLFSYQKSEFGEILEGLRLENVDICYGHLEYFTDTWDILRPFCVHFFGFGTVHQEKSGNPAPRPIS